MRAVPAAVRADAILLLTAAIWGLAFAAQRVGMAVAEPFGFNAARFFLGSLVLLPVVIYRGTPAQGYRRPLLGGALLGLPLFVGSSLQQVGLVYTTAGKAGFITGLYVILVPVLGLFLRHAAGWGVWLGAGLATAGLYLLSVESALTLAPGDGLVLVGAVFWAVHVHLIGWLSPRADALILAAVQFAVCGLLSLLTAVACEDLSPASLVAAGGPILYTGAMSVGVAYTLQIIGQRHARPGHAAIILSLETVFAALGGYLVLGETLAARQGLGAALMLTGMLASMAGRRAGPP